MKISELSEDVIRKGMSVGSNPEQAGAEASDDLLKAMENSETLQKYRDSLLKMLQRSGMSKQQIIVIVGMELATLTLGFRLGMTAALEQLKPKAGAA